MGEIKDKLTGAANIGGGRIRQGLARDMNDPDMNAGGMGQELKGRVQRTLGGMKGFVGGMLQRLGSRTRRN